MLRSKLTCLAILVCALGGSGCGAATIVTPSRQGDVPVVLGEGRARTGSRSASDWVSNAEFVIALTVVGEVRGKVAQEDMDRQEGMISREVVLRVDRNIWSAPDVKVVAPQEVSQQAVGWVFNTNNGSGERRLAIAHASRLEVGHSYVMAIDWVDDPCSNDPLKGQWSGLGAFGTIPFDNGILGYGEIEGQVQDLRNNREEMPTLRSEIAGRSVDELVAILGGAERKNIAPHEVACEPED